MSPTAAKHANIALFVPHNGCPHTCSFCNQRTISGESSQPTPEDVLRVLTEDAQRCSGNFRGRELAFFGGSFTAIDRDYMISLLEAARPFIGKSIEGIRCSTRPDCIDGEVLALLKEYGVTAIELGAQTMDDRVLALNERGHTAAHVEEASRLIREWGIELGLQMMTGLYGDTDEGAVETACRLADLRPATVRIYPTVVLEGTTLARLYRSGEYIPQTLEQAVELCATLLEMFAGRDIKVIRLGLHASADVEQNRLAGAYHPALRELCEAKIYLRRMIQMAAADRAIVGFAVHPKELSKALGQRRSNISALKEYMDDPAIKTDGELSAGEIKPVYKV